MTAYERFLKYIVFETTSDEESETVPSTHNQKVFGRLLAFEMADIGFERVSFDEKGYLYGFIPATKGRENDCSIGFIAHMDTSDAVSGKGIKAQTVLYEEGDLKLDFQTFIPESELVNYKGQELIVTDGTTLLGADDKAGIAEIFSACEYLVAHPEIPHGKIGVCITPDEEIGRGADYFDVEKFGCDWAYTIDGGELGEIEFENFNAATAKIKVNGYNVHPGSAKNKMKNASLILSELIMMLPQAETPSHTELYEGFYHLTSMIGDESEAKAGIIIRDHDREKFESRKEFIKNTVAYLNSVYGENTIELEITDSYYNMKEKILPHYHIIENAVKAMEANGVTPKIVPIRGGTDGARLSFMGLPCPNLSTGGVNFHSVREFIPVKSLEKMVEVIVSLMRNDL